MSTRLTQRGRHGLRVMVDLAEHEGWVSLGEVAERQGISRKYLEGVMSALVSAGYVESRRGKGGGYRLAKDPDAYTVGSILRATEGHSLAPVDCLDCAADAACPKALECPTQPVWAELGRITSEFLDSKTLADLIREPARML